MLRSCVCGVSQARRSFGGASLFFVTLTLALLFFFVFLPPSARAMTYVSGTISQNTTWSTAGSPYVLTGSNVTVATGVTLTVQSGVVVKPQSSNTSLTVNGNLAANGAIFTSYKDDSQGGDTNGDGSATTPAPGDWNRVNFSSSFGNLTSCTFSYGSNEVIISGSSANVTISGSNFQNSSNYGLYITSRSPNLSISGSIFSNNAAGGLYASVALANLYSNSFTNNNGPAVTLSAISGSNVYSNTYSGNQINGMYLSGDITQNTTWPASNSPYVIQGIHGGQIGNKWMEVIAGSTLTISPGSVVKFFIRDPGVSHNTDNTLNIYGSLNADGAIFTSFKDDAYGGDTNGDASATSPQPGDWNKIKISSATPSNISGSTISYGGSYSAELDISGSSGSHSITGSTVANSLRTGITIGSANTAISGSSITGNGGDGLSATGILATLSSNSFTNNSGVAVKHPAVLGSNFTSNTYSGNQLNGMLLTGHVTASTTWPGSSSPYVLDGVRQGTFVFNWYTAVNSGVTLTIDSGAVVKMQSIHRIDILTGGTLNAYGAVFTSFTDDTVGGDANADGSATQPAPGDWQSIRFNGGGGVLDGCIIRYGGQSGTPSGDANIAIGSNSSPTISHCAISYSVADGIWLGSGTPSIHYNDIFTNANDYYGFEATSGQIDAKNNWWGGSGPKPYGTGNAVSSGVIAAPWSPVPLTLEGNKAKDNGTDTWCGKYGEPVNTSTGSFYYEHEDLSIATRGLPLDFRRTYNSNDANDGSLGYGWSFNWQVSIGERSNGDIVVLRGDGRVDTFTKNPDNSYAAPAGRHDILVKNPDGTYKITTKEQITYNFNAENRLSSVVSETGQATTLTYDANKRLAAITEPVGRSLTLSYNTANRIDHITDPLGNTVSFSYSAAGDLTSVTDQIAGITSFTQDSFHHITSITDPNGHAFVNNIYDAQGKVVNQTDAEGHLLTFDYSVPSQTTMTTQMDPNDPSKDEITIHHYDSQLRLTSETDPYGEVTSYTYDSQGNRSATTDRRGVTTSQSFDAAGNTTDLYKAQGLPEEQHTHLTYNPKNHPLTKTDARGYTTSYNYDATGSYVTQISYPQVTNYDSSTSNYSESFTYNTDGTVATSTDKNGDVTGYTYDSNGNPDVITKNTNRPIEDQVTLDYDFDAMGRKTHLVDGNGKATTYEYNAIGDLRFVRTQVTNPDTGLPEDVVTEYQYDANGNKTAMIDPEGKTTSYSYTAMDNLSQITDANLNTIEHTYDATYNRTATKDRNGNWTNFGFNKNNQLISATDPENNTTTYGLNEEGNQTSSTDPLGRIVTRSYDGLGRMTSMTEPDEGGATRTTSYAYDDADNLLSTTDPAGHTYAQVYDELSRLKQASDPLSNSVYYRYDGAGNRTKMKDQRGYETAFYYSPNDMLAAVTDPLNSVTSYGYDKNGNRTSQLDAEGHTTLYAFDELNRITSEKVDAGGGNWLLEKSYAYDKAGNLTKDTTGEGSISYSYDNVYNLTGITDRQNATYSFTYDGNQNQLTAVETATNKTVSFAYNPRGMLSQATDAHGASESFTYDGAGNLTQRNDSVAGQNFTTSFDHTPRNQVKSVTRGTDTSTFSFDAAGNLTGKTYPNGVTTSFAYDADNRLSSQQAIKDAQTLQTFSQNFDGAGNITQLTENGTLTTSYGYDQLSRLISENIGGYGNVSYSYDRVGNRLTLDNPTTGLTDYSYNQANQLTGQVNGAITTDFTYDANGAITEKTMGADTTSYAYNGLDKLTEVTTPATTVNYGYDTIGRKIERSEADSATRLHYSGKSDMADYWTDGTDTLTAGIVRGPDGLISFTGYFGGQPWLAYQSFNPHGDTTMITDASGVILNNRYDAFGNTIAGPYINYGYTGKWQRYTDGTTGDIQMGVREYDAGLGRFVSEDPLRGPDTDPQQRNRYTYTSNNPLVRYDLNGLWWGGDAWGWVADKTSDVAEVLRRPEFGGMPRTQFADSEFAKMINDPRINMGLLIGIGPIGGFGSIGGMGAEGAGSRAACSGISGEGTKLLGPATQFGEKIEGQLASRGWTKPLVQSVIDDPVRSVATRDTRFLSGGGRLNDPATAFYGRRGGYVVRSNRTGDIVQISDRTTADWRAPWD